MVDVSTIVGATIYTYWNSLFERMYCRLIVWDSLGKLYFTESYGIYFIKGIEDNLITDSIASSMYDVFRMDNRIYPCSEIQYNTILSRIEDIYGMSISEFSLEQLDYVDL